MQKFKVAVMQSSSQVFIIEADNPEQAIEKISDDWDNEKIEIDNPCSSEVDFAFIGNINYEVQP